MPEAKVSNLPALTGNNPVALKPETYRKLRAGLAYRGAGRTGRSKKGIMGEGGIQQRCRNTSGDVIPRFSLVEVIAPCNTTAAGDAAYQDQQVFDLKYPPELLSIERSLGITVEAIPDGAFGRVITHGFSTLSCYVTDPDDTYVTVDQNGIPTTSTEATRVRIHHMDPAITGSSPDSILKVYLGGGAGTGGVFAVSLTVAGGTQGTGTTEPTWTYDVYDPATGTQLNTMGPIDPTVNGHKWRRHLGQMSPADYGYATRADATTDGFTLGWINEQDVFAECEDPPGGPDGP